MRLFYIQLAVKLHVWSVKLHVQGVFRMAVSDKDIVS